MILKRYTAKYMETRMLPLCFVEFFGLGTHLLSDKVYGKKFGVVNALSRSNFFAGCI